MKTLLISLFFLVAAVAFAQTQPRSHEDCIKEVPGPWGPNFGDDWHHHESLYWGCRLGVSAETVVQWQKAADEQAMAQDIIPINIWGQELVIFEEVGGDAHCFTLKVLKSAQSGWVQAWELPIPRNSMDYCTLACPSLKVSMAEDVLTVSSPTTSDPFEDKTFSCKKVSWQNERFYWNGSSFERLTKDGNRQSATLAGIVVDPRGAVIPGATVTVHGGNTTEKTVSTDGAGVFAITMVPGIYSLTVKRLGFFPVSRDVQANSGKVLYVAFTLKIVATHSQPRTDSVENINVPGSHDRLRVVYGGVSDRTESPSEIVFTGNVIVTYKNLTLWADEVRLSKEKPINLTAAATMVGDFVVVYVPPKPPIYVHGVTLGFSGKEYDLRTMNPPHPN